MVDDRIMVNSCIHISKHDEIDLIIKISRILASVDEEIIHMTWIKGMHKSRRDLYKETLNYIREFGMILLDGFKVMPVKYINKSKININEFNLIKIRFSLENGKNEIVQTSDILKNYELSKNFMWVREIRAFGKLKESIETLMNPLPVFGREIEKNGEFL